MELLGTLAFGVITSFLNRIRGGYLGDILHTGDTEVRILYSLPFGILAGLHFQDIWSGVAISAGMILGLLMKWDPWFLLEKMPKDLFSMSLRGIYVTLYSSVILGFLYGSAKPAILFLLAGSTMGICYWIGKIIWKKLPTYKEPLSSQTCYGEFIYGMVLGGLFYSILRMNLL